jgi:hypothetical protein
LTSLVCTLTTLAPLSLQATKQSLNEIAAGDYDLRRLRLRELLTTQSADFAEGRAAFAKRRVPTLNGR